MKENQITYKNTTVSYRDSGHGNTIVLLHGYLENNSMWDFFIPKLTQENRVVSVDLLGHGKTGCLGYIHTMEEQADLVLTVINHLKIQKVILIGHSMGGYIALAFAEKYSNYIFKLVLLNSTAYDDNEERKRNRDRAIKMVKRDYESFVRLSISNLFSNENQEMLQADIENVKLEALKTPLQGIIAAQEGMKIRKNRLEVLHKAKYAILLALSIKDPVLEYEIHQKQIENTSVQLASLEHGHMSHIESKKSLLEVLLAFIN